MNGVTSRTPRQVVYKKLLWYTNVMQAFAFLLSFVLCMMVVFWPNREFTFQWVFWSWCLSLAIYVSQPGDLVALYCVKRRHMDQIGFWMGTTSSVVNRVFLLIIGYMAGIENVGWMVTLLLSTIIFVVGVYLGNKAVLERPW